MSLVAHPTVALPQPIVIDNQDTLTRLIAEVKEEIFRHLKPEDHVFLMQSARLLSLRDSNPSKCIGEAGILLSDFSVPRCWRARAGIYRAESFMILGFDQFAKEQLTLAARVLETDDHLQPSDRIDRKRHEILEGLVAWNIALGKISLVLPSSSFLSAFQFRKIYLLPFRLQKTCPGEERPVLTFDLKKKNVYFILICLIVCAIKSAWPATDLMISRQIGESQIPSAFFP